jgi:hypothetical protein
MTAAGEPYDFERDLAASEARAEDPRWWRLYHRLFAGQYPELVDIAYNRDKATQRAGVDRILTFEDGSRQTVDEKEERRDLADFILEVWSNEERQVPGWARGGKSCDWLGWLTPAGFWLLDYRQVCALYAERKWEWRAADYRRIAVRNRGYTTVSVKVPRSEVLRAVRYLWTSPE